MKFLEKHGLFKLVCIILLIAVVLTWLTPTGSFSAGSFTTDDYSRVGLFDLSTYGLLGFNYFPYIFIFLFIVAGFYRLLETTDAYQAITDKIAKLFERKVLLFTIISMVVYGLLSSVVIDYLVLIILVPFTISIMAKMKSTKISSFVATFGGILLGTLCSTLNGTVSTVLTTYFEFTNFTPEYIAAGIVFVIGSLLLGYLTYEDLKKNKDNEEKRTVDLFADKKVVEEIKVEEVKTTKKATAKKSTKSTKAAETKTSEVVKVKKKVNVVPMAVIYVIVLVMSLLSYVNWENIGVSLFTDIHTYITEATIGGATVYDYILGSSSAAFGSWTLFMIAALLLIATLILAIIYNIGFNKVIESYLEGFKRIGKTVLIIFFIYIVLETSYFFPTIETIVNWAVDTFGDNIGSWLFASAFTGIFNVEFQYVMAGISELVTYLGTDTPEIVALASQFGYGLISFVAPTSIMLAAGLSMFDIKVKDYYKFIWKFFVAMLVVLVIVLAILLLI